MSGAMSDGRNDAFQDRLKRIQDARAAEFSDMLDDDGNALPDRTDISPLPDWKENVRYPAAIVAAALVGMLSVFIARFARYHLSGGSLAGGESADIYMLIDGGLAAALSFTLFTMMKFQGAEFKAAQTAGIAAMVCIMHNFVHAAPKAFDVIFSPDWTEEVIAATEPASILFRGVSFVVMPDAEPEEEEKKMPTIRRL